MNETEFITTPIENIKEELEGLLAPEIEQGNLEIFRELNDVKIRFKSDDLYTSGSAELEDEASEILNRVLAAFRIISYNDFEIDVEGHTDNVPISSSKFESNWELSTARASNIVKYFSNMGINQDRLKASGYADSRPVVEFDEQGNPYPASKDKNRRVVLRLFYSGIPERIASTDSLSTQEELIEEILNQENEEIAATDGEAENPENTSRLASDENLTESENTEIKTPNEPVTESVVAEVAPPPAQTNSPQSQRNNSSIGNFENGCRYSVQVGGFESFANSFNFSRNAEQKTGVPFEIMYDNLLFSIRTASMKSFSETIALQRTIEENLDGDQITGFVQQCYDDGRLRPQPLKYQIQLAFFQNEQNAISFRETMAQQYNIEAVIEQKSLQAYTVLTTPINSISAAQNRLRTIKNIDILSGAFIKYDPSTVSEYSFTYQIQLGSFATKREIDLLAQRLREELNVQSSIKTFNNGRYYLVTRPYTDWEEISELYSIIERDSSELFPVIYLIERV